MSRVAAALLGLSLATAGAGLGSALAAPSATAADHPSPAQCARIHHRYAHASTERAQALALVRGVVTGCFVEMEPSAWAWALDVLDPDHQ